MSGNYELVYLKVVGIFTKLLFSVLMPISFCITPESFLLPEISLLMNLQGRPMPVYINREKKNEGSYLLVFGSLS